MVYQYYIIEIKRDINGELEHQVHWAFDENREQAWLKGESKYHEVLSRAAISEHETHVAILMDSVCQPLEHKVFGRYEVPTEGGETT